MEDPSYLALQKIATDDKWDGIDAKVNEATPDDGAEAVGTVVAWLVTLYNEVLLKF